jgi:inner membrane protein
MHLGIGIPALYLIYALYNKMDVVEDVQTQLKEQKISYKDYITTPTLMNTWLWFVMIRDENGYYIGHRSVFDNEPYMKLRYFQRNDSLLQGIQNREDAEALLEFSNDYYVVEKWNDTTVFQVLRFGQVTGWENPSNRFAFYYYVDHPEANDLVVQRGRFENWNRQTASSFIRRIRGK